MSTVAFKVRIFSASELMIWINSSFVALFSGAVLMLLCTLWELNKQALKGRTSPITMRARRRANRFISSVELYKLSVYTRVVGFCRFSINKSCYQYCDVPTTMYDARLLSGCRFVQRLGGKPSLVRERVRRKAATLRLCSSRLAAKR